MTVADREYWEDRARRHGEAACGCLNPIEYHYEERLRWDAFRRLVTPRADWEVLDVGCGTGIWSRRIAAMGPRVVGADFSSEIIKLAKPAEHVEFVVSSAQDLDLAGGRFDLVLSVTVLQHITDAAELDRALTNLRRMLKPGGLLFLLEYSPNRPKPLPAGAGHMRYRTRAEWISLCVAAGFELVKMTGVRFVGHRLLGGGLSRWRRLSGHGDPAGAASADLTGGERVLKEIATAIDLISARVPGNASRSDLHAFVFRRKD